MPLTAIAYGLKADECSTNARHFSRKSAGTAPIFKPRKSLTWLEKMMTAMPLVNPMTTGCGTNLMTAPSVTAPMMTRKTPAMTRRDGEAVVAVLLNDAVDDDDERAGGAADLYARSAERGDDEAGDDGG